MTTISEASRSMDATRSLHVIVVVLGDIGRSPRMQYHALSLLQEGYTVSLVGYTGEDLIPDLHSYTGRLKVIRFTTTSPKALRKILPLYFAWRIFSLVIGLMWALLVSVPSNPPVDCILVQNPPAIPLILVSYLYCRFMGLWKNRPQPAFIIDWHNLGYSMLRKGTVQRIAQWYETKLAPLADGHFCVTSAMKAFLQKNMDIDQNIRVLHDCPPAMFRPTSIAEQHALLSRLHPQLCAACPRSWYEGLDSSKQTLLTEEISGTFVARNGRPALVTSSTSWTEDEDFGVLLDALIILDHRLSKEHSSLHTLVLVTGKGPMKAMYEERISRLKLRHVAVQTLWLEPADYPRLLACADLGISLHTSTSGLDLPMKVLDLFGCEVPVCALNFQCLSELVLDGVNGQVFDSSHQLAEQLRVLLSPISDPSLASSPLAEYSHSLQGRTRWSENWKNNALPGLLEACRRKASDSQIST